MTANAVSCCPPITAIPSPSSAAREFILFDREGNRYLDFVAGLGVNALGHAHPRVVKAIREQAARAIHFSNLYYHEYQGRLAEKLCQLSGLNRAFFSNSGTEAIEGSIKLARLAGHRVGGEAKSQLVALEGSYHGRTFGAMSLTGQDKYRKGFEPLLEEVKFVPRNDVAALHAAVDDRTCAIVLEPIFGEGGIYECSASFLQECRAVADRHKAALIFDEIQCGLGRTGTIFAFQSFGVIPDIVAIAKPIAAGLPLGAISGQGRNCLGNLRRPARNHFRRRSAGLPGSAGISGHHRRRESAGKCFSRGRVPAGALKSLAGKYAAVQEVRGRGLIQGLQLAIPARPIVEQALAEGVLFNSTQDTVLRFLPPFLLAGKARGQRHARAQETIGEKAEVTHDAVAAIVETKLATSLIAKPRAHRAIPRRSGARLYGQEYDQNREK